MKFFHLIFTSLLFIQGCSGLNYSWQMATQNHEEIIKELKLSREKRYPASVRDSIKAGLKDLNRLSPGKFEVYVFPKLSNKHLKIKDEAEEYLGRPQVYEVSTLAVSDCKVFIQNNLFGKYLVKDAFPEELAIADRECSILEFTSKKLRELNKADLKVDDLLKMRLYVDDEYHVYAMDYESYLTPSKTQTIRIKQKDDQFFSGLNFFPVDLPLKHVRPQEVQLKDIVSAKIDDISVFQVRKRLNRSFTLPDCKAKLFEQKNTIGEKTRIGWCEKMPWPSFTENSRFISVVQPLTLK